MLKNVAVALALFGGIAAAATIPARPGPQPGAKSGSPQSFQPLAAASQTFAGTCSANEKVADSRVEPAWVGQSYAGDGCVAPSLPRQMNGYTASRPQVLAGMAAQKKYIAQASAYQRCIVDFVAARRAVADRDKKSIDVAMTVIENHRLAASQADRQKVADQVKITIAAFNEAGSEDCK